MICIPVESKKEHGQEPEMTTFCDDILNIDGAKVDTIALQILSTCGFVDRIYFRKRIGQRHMIS